MKKFEIVILTYELDGPSKTVYQALHDCKTIAAAKELAEKKYYEWAVKEGYRYQTRLHCQWQEREFKNDPGLKGVFKSGRVKVRGKYFRNSLYLNWRKKNV